MVAGPRHFGVQPSSLTANDLDVGSSENFVRPIVDVEGGDVTVERWWQGRDSLGLIPHA